MGLWSGNPPILLAIPGDVEVMQVRPVNSTPCNLTAPDALRPM